MAGWELYRRPADFQNSDSAGEVFTFWENKGFAFGSFFDSLGARFREVVPKEKVMLSLGF